MKNKTCCFTGHRIIKKDDVTYIKKNLEQSIENLIERGVIYFGCGGAIGFDTLAAETVIELKRKYPEIKLILVLPCADQNKYWNEKDKAVYKEIKSKADKVRILSGTYFPGCMQTRNRHLIDNSGFCIAYLRKQTGGTEYTVRYAKNKGVKVIYI